MGWRVNVGENRNDALLTVAPEDLANNNGNDFLDKVKLNERCYQFL
jgi:hypothetical protein